MRAAASLLLLPAQAEDKALNLYSWSSYIPEQALARFRKRPAPGSSTTSSTTPKSPPWPAPPWRWRWSACIRSGIRRVRRAHRGGLAAALDIFTTSEWNPAISKPFHIRPGRLAGGRLPACKGRFTAPDPEG
ncbi:hypothetical protein D3C72_1793330 [compost metagenome]